MLKIGSKLIGFLLSKTARFAAGAVGVVTNAAVRKMILGQAAKKTALTLASAYGVYEAAAFVYDEIIEEDPKGVLRLQDGTPPPSTTKEEIEEALRRAGYDPETRLSEQNFPGLVKAIRANSRLPKAKIDALEAAMYRELAAEKAEDAVEPAVAEYLEEASGGGLGPPPVRDGGGAIAIARAINGVARFTGRPAREIPRFLQQLEFLRAAPPADVEAAVELMKESARADAY